MTPPPQHKSLTEYARKRDFEETPEPAGADQAEPGGDPIFVVQKHDASRLHYDFRLQIGGTLASWAVPKGPSLDPADKRLAVRVEDHPLDYAGFEGMIPEGNYGAGPVLLWDTGRWTPEDADPERALKRGKLSFTLEGRKLGGAWTLTRLRAKASDRDDRGNWLLIKRRDDAARAGGDVLAEHPESVKSGRVIEQIADGADARRRPPRPAPKPRRVPGRKQAHADPPWPELAGRPSASLPKAVTPQLCTLADTAPAGEEWLHEIKFDGYRLLARRSGKQVRLLTRTGLDWTDRFPPIADAVATLPGQDLLLDGEAVILDAHGHTSFQALQQAIKKRRFSNLAFYVFDLLHLDAHDLTSDPLIDRKELLRRLLAGADGPGVLRYSDHVIGGGPGVQSQACELALEGMISKRIDAPYTHGRSKSWLKIKCSRRQEFVVIGFTRPSGTRKHFGALLLGAHDADGRLLYTGRVGTGFNAATLRDLRGRMDPLTRKTCPADEPPMPAESRGVTWVTPQLVAEVEFTQWTDDGRLRHPSYQGLREDKPSDEVRIEQTQPDAKPKPSKSRKPAGKTSGAAARQGARRTPAPPSTRNRRGAAGVTVAGVTITNPDRVVFPDAGITKADLARYYEQAAHAMLPFLAGRPLSTVRCPRGRLGSCFFQKNIGESFSEPVRSVTVPEKNGTADYIAVDSVEGLVTLAQFGVIEIHPWGSKAGDLKRPDTLTFDLDPGEGVGLEELVPLARHLRDVLAVCGLESFPKLTGGKGLHVVVPLKPHADWDDVKAFCRAIARGLAAESPGKYTATATKSKRAGKVFIDYLRNAMGATSVAPYSARARSGAPCAVPIRWEDLGRVQSPAQYTVESTPRRLARLRSDPWEGYHDTRQQLTPARVRAVVDA
tara:strand:+ start:21095 stop:23767 length:2673 start_codon:yes stop_codon:yes gene_type:complete